MSDCEKLVNGSMFVFFFRLEDDRREICLIDSVGEPLGFNAESGMLIVVMFPSSRLVFEKVTCVELNCRLRPCQFETASAFGVGNC